MAKIIMSSSNTKGNTKLLIKQDKYILKANKYKKFMVSSIGLNILLTIILILKIKG
jgi:hypothetical protein